MNLFTSDLSFGDVNGFLRLGSGTDLRLEATRIEFKETPQSKIGDAVAAFSNTYGGLISSLATASGDQRRSALTDFDRAHVRINWRATQPDGRRRERVAPRAAPADDGSLMTVP
jgi:hypothetical protein